MDSGQTTFYTAYLIIGVLVGIIIIVFIASMIRHQRRHNRLHKSKILAEITTLEKERTRIAADLHDELGPILSAAKFKINSLDISNDEDQYQLDMANKHIDDIIRRMREISADLMPGTLLRKGLVAAIEETVYKINNTGNLSISFASRNIPSLKNEMAVNIYRIVQEIIHNTVKHAGASSLRLELKLENDVMILMSQDNGKGIDYSDAVKKNPGLGLRNMLSRAEILEGEMFIDSKPGKGAAYIFEIPLAPNSD